MEARSASFTSSELLLPLLERGEEESVVEEAEDSLFELEELCVSEESDSFEADELAELDELLEVVDVSVLDSSEAVAELLVPFELFESFEETESSCCLEEKEEEVVELSLDLLSLEEL